jgi:outer membrane protein assembly factor BamB
MTGYYGSYFCIGNNQTREYRAYYCLDNSCNYSTSNVTNQTCAYGCNATTGNCNPAPPDNAPNVFLTYPLNNTLISTYTGYIIFKYLPIDDRGFTNATLWGNFTGVWAAYASNQTAIANKTNNSLTTTLISGYYKWNVLVCDNATPAVQCNFAIANFTLNVSTPPPLAPEDEWQQFRYNASHTGYSPSGAPSTNITNWTYTSPGSASISSPAVADGRVFIRFYDGSYGRVYALNKTTSALLWNSTSEWLYGRTFSPAVWNGRLYIISGGYGVALNAIDYLTGSVLWTYNQNYGITSSPTIANGKVFFIENSGIYLRALNATTGAGLWTHYEFVGEQSAIVASPTVADGIVVYGLSDGRVIALNETTGGAIWSYNVGGIVRSSPAIAYDKVFVGSANGTVYAFNKSGALVWNYMTNGSITYSSPAIANGRVFIGSNDGKVYSLNATTGELIWNYTTGGAIASSPAVAGGKVFIGSNDGKLYVLNENSAVLIWSYATGGAVQSSPAVAGGAVFVGSDDRKLYVFGLS